MTEYKSTMHVSEHLAGLLISEAVVPRGTRIFYVMDVDDVM